MELKEVCNDPLLLYCWEVLPRLKSVQISLLTDHHRLALTEDCAVITYPEADNAAPRGSSSSCKLDLASHSLQLTNSLLSLKLKTHSPLSSPAVPRDMLTTCDDSPSLLSLLCGFCNSKLTEPENIFKRVLPLPSDSWAEFSGGIFCHYHENKGDGKKEGETPFITPSTFTITPKDGDCLYSDSTLLLTERCLDKQRIHEDSALDAVLCSRCLMPLGSRMRPNDSKAAAISLHRSSVRVVLPKERPSSSPSPTVRLENHFAVLLYSFTQSKMTFRYFVKDRSGHSHLHIWMLNVCSELRCNADPSIYYKFSGCGGAGTESSTVLKVLFKCDVKEAENGSSLDSDMELSSEECLQLKLLLVDSNRSLPPAQRIASGYNVGYLHFFTYS